MINANWEERQFSSLAKNIVKSADVFITLIYFCVLLLLRYFLDYPYFSPLSVLFLHYPYFSRLSVLFSIIRTFPISALLSRLSVLFQLLRYFLDYPYHWNFVTCLVLWNGYIDIFIYPKPGPQEIVKKISQFAKNFCIFSELIFFSNWTYSRVMLIWWKLTLV